MIQSTLPRRAARHPNEPTPSLDRVRTIVADGGEAIRTVPIYREIMADLETPVSAFLKIWDGGKGFVLESVEGGQRLARYSFIGAGDFDLITLDGGIATTVGADGTTSVSYQDPLEPLAMQVDAHRALPAHGLPRFLGGAVGYLSYEAVCGFEPRVGKAAGPGLAMPDGRFVLVDRLLVFDHLERTIKAVAHVHVNGGDIEQEYARAAAQVDELVNRLNSQVPALPRGREPLTDTPAERAKSNTSTERYHAIVERAKEYIAAGDIIQVVLSQRVDVPTPAHPFTIYRALRTVNPSPYMFYLDFEDHQIVGASPELLVRHEDGLIINHPIAGTRPRGGTVEEDDALAEDLAADAKERAEHIMLVDLGRNDIGRVAAAGSVRVPQLMKIERYSHVMHLVSHVEGELDEGLTALDALRSCFPAGTVSGAPKVRAMEIIAELETDRRGPYAGAVGYVDLSGGMDTCIALRTLVVKDGVASMQAGGGIVADSTPHGEFAESHHKMRALLRAIELAEDLERTQFDAVAVAADSTKEGVR